MKKKPKPPETDEDGYQVNFARETRGHDYLLKFSPALLLPVAQRTGVHGFQNQRNHPT
jgi:hypothetical protein